MNNNFILHPIINSLFCGRMNHSDTFCSTINGFVVAARLIILEPTVSKVFIIVVSKVGSENHFATRAYRVNIVSDFNQDGVINIDIVRFACDSTTSCIGSSNCEDIRLIRRISSINDCISSLSPRTNRLVEESPFVIILHAFNCVVNHSLEHNNAVLANNLITSNLDSRIREDKERVGLHF